MSSFRLRTSLITVSAAVILFAACKPSAEDYVQFLYDSMPLPDSLVFPRGYWEANVAKTLEVRDRMGWDIPEREFRHFVLPLRVNNENLDDFRTVYADTLCARVEGMSIGEAALEINHWCHEMATYTPSDGRTLGPMALIRSGLGRCGEESVLAVSALRAAGIPARQVYTPRWAHTDDNHAWVEVFVDGSWHFMGACEPEPVLDLGWFNAPVSRAMLLHTKAYGNYDGPEDVISRTKAYTEINVIRNYIPTRRTTVTVLDDSGSPVEGADIEFMIYNYGEFYTVAHYKTDAAGKSGLDTGLGDAVIWAAKGDRFGLCVASSESNEIVLDKTFGGRYSMDLDIVPPVEDPLPDNATEEQVRENALRMIRENEIREARPHPRSGDPGLWLSEKDAIDVTPDVIEDALSAPLVGDRYVDCPRIELEMLMPYRQEIRSSGIGDKLKTPSDVVDWVKSNIRVDDSLNPQKLRIPPVAVWRSHLSDVFSRDLFFVALCRTLGFPSRFDPVSGSPQYLADGEWVAVNFDGGVEAVTPKGVIRTTYVKGNSSVVRPEYYRHYTLAKVAGGTTSLCEFSEYEPVASENAFDAGYYMMTSGTRLADGSVLAHVEFFDLPEGSEVEVPVVLRTAEDKISVMGNIDVENTFLPEGEKEEVTMLSKTGRGYFILCVMGAQDEPTIHAKGLLTDLAADLNGWGGKIILLNGARPSGLENMIVGEDVGKKVEADLLKGVKAAADAKLPYIAVADSFGRVVYFSQGYNTSLAAQLSNVLGQL